jgi:hypothetical protein
MMAGMLPIMILNNIMPQLTQTMDPCCQMDTCGCGRLSAQQMRIKMKKRKRLKK